MKNSSNESIERHSTIYHVLHHAFSVSYQFFDFLIQSQASAEIQRVQKLFETTVQTFSNAELNVLQESAVLYIQYVDIDPSLSEKENCLISAKKLFPLLSEIRLLKNCNTEVEVTSIDKQKRFNIQNPQKEQENPVERAQLFRDYLPYAVDVQTEQTVQLYEKVPSQFVVAQYRGKYGILAPYYFINHFYSQSSLQNYAI